MCAARGFHFSGLNPSVQILVNRIKERIYTSTVPTSNHLTRIYFLSSACYNCMDFCTEVFVYICVMKFLVNKYINTYNRMIVYHVDGNNHSAIRSAIEP